MKKQFLLLCCTLLYSISLMAQCDSLRLSANHIFVFNNSCDNTGTLTLSVTNPALARPLRYSLDGTTFTTDSVFRNVEGGPRFYYIRTAQGCNYSSYLTVNSRSSIQASIGFNDCANRLGRGTMNATVLGGVPPFSYRWSNNATTSTIASIPTGIYIVTVTDANGCISIATDTLTTCVWPGDTDTSGAVNVNDLLNIGLAFGATGGVRCRATTDSSSLCTQWAGYKVRSWSQQTPSGMNYKHIDANGDGVINFADTFAIVRNWGLTRNFGNGNPIEPRGAAPTLSIQASAIAPGQWAAFPIMLGDATNAATGVYGLSFAINYDPAVVDASSIYLTYEQNWLGTNILRISKNFGNSIETAISRTNLQNGSGVGQIATLRFKTRTGISARTTSFTIPAPNVINATAQIVPTNGQTTNTSIITAIDEPEWAKQITLAPNPTNDKVSIATQNIEIQSIEVFDVAGKSLLKTTAAMVNEAINLPNSGTYFLKIQTDKGYLTRKVVRL
jgi:Secretion system C-terminal sorting domain